MSVTFSWAKQGIIGQYFFNQCTSNGLTYRMQPQSGIHDSCEIEMWQNCGHFSAASISRGEVIIISIAPWQLPLKGKSMGKPAGNWKSLPLPFCLPMAFLSFSPMTQIWQRHGCFNATMPPHCCASHGDVIVNFPHSLPDFCKESPWGSQQEVRSQSHCCFGCLWSVLFLCFSKEISLKWPNEAWIAYSKQNSELVGMDRPSPPAHFSHRKCHCSARSISSSAPWNIICQLFIVFFLNNRFIQTERKLYLKKEVSQGLQDYGFWLLLVGHENKGIDI